MKGFSYVIVIVWFATAPDLFAQADGQPWNNERRYAADTSALLIRRQDALLDEARLALETTGWRRLLPAVRFNLTFSNRSLLLSPLSDNADMSLLQPAGNWTLSLAWPVSSLLDPMPRRRALATVRVAEINRELAVQLHLDAKEDAAHWQRLKQLEIDHLSRLLQLLIQKRNIEEDLLRLAELKYEQGELSFEGRAAARLRLLELERQIAEARYHLTTAREEMP